MDVMATPRGRQPNWKMATISAGISAMITSIIMRLVSVSVLTWG